MLRNLLTRCGMIVGHIEPDPELQAAADEVRDAMTEWKEQVQAHAVNHAQSKPPAPMRRVK